MCCCCLCMRAARRVGGQQRSAHAYQTAHVEGAADLPLQITEAPGTAVQLDPRMGTWTCVFCDHGNSDKGLLVLGDAHARPPMASCSTAALAVAIRSCSCPLSCMTCTSCCACSATFCMVAASAAERRCCKRGSGCFSSFPAESSVIVDAPGQAASDSRRQRPQACPELVQEAVEYVEPVSGTDLEAPPAPAVLVAVDATLDGPELGALQAALLEARPTVCLQAHPWHEMSCHARAGCCACRCQPKCYSAEPKRASDV